MKKKRGALVLIFTLLLLLSAGMLWRRHLPPSAKISRSSSASFVTAVNPALVATASARLKQAEIDLTAAGFVPQNLTVTTNTAVLFVNKTASSSMQIKFTNARDLPDQTQPQDNFAVTLRQTETINYINSLTPEVSGTITVHE